MTVTITLLLLYLRLFTQLNKCSVFFSLSSLLLHIRVHSGLAPVGLQVGGVHRLLLWCVHVLLDVGHVL